MNIKKYEELVEKNKKLESDYYYLNKLYNEKIRAISIFKFFKKKTSFLLKEGLFTFLIRKIKKYLRKVKTTVKIILRPIKRVFESLLYHFELKRILQENKGKKIVVFYPGYDFNMAMYQRPQHIASQFAKKGYLYFYCTLNISEKVHGFQKIEEGLYVTNQFNILKKMKLKYTLQMYANMNACSLREFKYFENKCDNILYEYIDDLHEDLTSISKHMIERHRYALSNPKIRVVATSTHLYNKALKYRDEKNIILSTNGVVYDDFHITVKPQIPAKIAKIVSENSKIVTYYGALAKWFDYDLIKKFAFASPDINIVLIGIDYDDSFAKYNYFKDVSNIHYIGLVPYKELINYGYYSDALIIPFLINEITLATSPVKVFEYMSMEKIIVTTDLPECRKYKSIYVAKNHEEFIEVLNKKLKKGLTIAERKLMKNEALENTWSKKVEEMEILLK